MQMQMQTQRCCAAQAVYCTARSASSRSRPFITISPACLPAASLSRNVQSTSTSTASRHLTVPSTLHPAPAADHHVARHAVSASTRPFPLPYSIQPSLGLTHGRVTWLWSWLVGGLVGASKRRFSDVRLPSCQRCRKAVGDGGPRRCSRGTRG